ncbi:MAG: sugar ABC transporter permease [Bacillota bacterium]
MRGRAQATIARYRGRGYLGHKLEMVAAYGLLLMACMAVLYPVLWIVSCSLKATAGLVGSSLIPSEITLENYRRIFTDNNINFPLWFFNTTKVSSLSSLGALALTTPAAYAFSRMRFAGRRYWLMCFLVAQMFPSFMAIVALYTLLGWSGLIDTHLGLIGVYAGGSIPFSVWLLKGYFDSVPRDIEESALIDGATKFQAFRRILLPLARPILYVVGLINFIGPYAEYLVAQVVVTSSRKWTLAIGMRSLTVSQFATTWPLFSAVSVLTAVPIIVIFLSAEKYIVSGLTRGALK